MNPNSRRFSNYRDFWDRLTGENPKRGRYGGGNAQQPDRAAVAQVVQAGQLRGFRPVRVPGGAGALPAETAGGRRDPGYPVLL